MIEVTVDQVEGVRFIKDFKIVEPVEKRHGIVIEHVDCRVLRHYPQYADILKVLRLRKVGHDFAYDAEIYAYFPMGYFWYKSLHSLMCCYWRGLKWLYDNARMFKQIPPGECFSWRYFTPYTWLRRHYVRGNT